MPTPRRRAAAGEPIVTSLPSNRILPESGWTTPASTFISVDFPAPFSPTTAWIMPRSTSRLRPSRAVTPPYRFLRSRTETRGAIRKPCGAGTPRAPPLFNVGLLLGLGFDGLHAGWAGGGGYALGPGFVEI